MPNPKDSFKDRLARYRQIKISVIGRKSGGSDGDLACETKNVRATEIARKFGKAINAHDTGGLTNLISSDHVFVDSIGNRFPAPAMWSGWQEYFTMVTITTMTAIAAVGRDQRGHLRVGGLLLSTL